jgi:tetratricopeptide (TPR) repeat protein
MVEDPRSTFCGECGAYLDWEDPEPPTTGSGPRRVIRSRGQSGPAPLPAPESPAAARPAGSPGELDAGQAPDDGPRLADRSLSDVMAWLPAATPTPRQAAAGLGWALLCAGRATDADRALGAALEEQGDEPPTRDLYALRAAAAEVLDPVAAAAYYTKALRAGLAGRAVLARLPRLLAGGLGEVIASPQLGPMRAAARNPADRAAVEVGAGLVAAMGGRREVAAEALRAALATDATVARREGLAAVDETCARLPGMPEGAGARVALARVLRELGEAESAEDEARRVHDALMGNAEREAVDAEACDLLGLLAEDRDRHEDAARWYGEAGRLFTRHDQQQRAVAVLRRTVALGGTAEDRWVLADAERVLALSGEVPDARLLHVALEHWEDGRRLADPGPENAWSYVLRATLCTDLSECEPAEARLWSWRAVVDLERSLVLAPGDGWKMVRLGSAYAQIGLVGVAEEIFDRVPGAEGEPAEAARNGLLFARVVRWEIDHLHELVAEALPDDVRIILHLRRWEYDDVLAVIDRIPAEEQVTWHAWARAFAMVRLRRGDAPAALRDLLGRTDLAVDVAAWAHLFLGDPGRAWGAVEPELGRLGRGDADPSDILFYAGLALLALGRVEQGERYVCDAVARPRYPAKAEGFARQLEWIATGHGFPVLPATTVAAMRRCRAAAAQAVHTARAAASMPVGQGALWEFEAAAAEPDLVDPPRALACLLGRARAARSAGDPYASLRAWHRILSSGADVPGAVKAVVGTVECAEPALLSAGRACEALEVVELAMSALPVDDPGTAILAGHRDLARLLEGSSTKAEAALREIAARDAVAVDRLCGIWCDVIPDARAFWRCYDTLSRSEEPRVRSLAQDLLPWLDRWVLGEDPAPPEPAPDIVLEISWDLVPEDTTVLWPLLGTLFPAMRERVFADAGLVLTGVRIRGGPETTGRAYRVLLQGVERAAGTLPEGDSDGLLLEALERAVRAEPARLVTVETVDRTLERLRGLGDGPEIEEVQADPGAVTRLADAARTMVAEQARVGDWAVLLRAAARPPLGIAGERGP